MAFKHRCKGTVVSQDLVSTYVTVASVISIDLPDMETETYEADTLDNTGAGILYQPTGRTEGGSMSGEIFYDPADGSHGELTAILTDPENSVTSGDNLHHWRIVFTNTGASQWTFDGAGFGMGGTVALNDGLKASFSVKLSGIPTFTV